MNEKTPLERACDAVGSPINLANLLGVSIQVLTNWKQRESVPVTYCVPIEAATHGEVTRLELRPDDGEQIWPDFEPRKKAKVS